MYKRFVCLSNAFLLVAVCLTMMMVASTSRAAGTVFDDRIDWEALLSLGELDGTNGFRLDGVHAGDQSGGSLSSAGDVNGDGLFNGLEYVYGTDPAVATTDPMAGRIELVNAGGFIEIRLTTVSPLTDVELAIDVTSNLLSEAWADVTADFQLSISNQVSPYVGRTYRSLVPAATLPPTQFYRLRVTPVAGP